MTAQDAYTTFLVLANKLASDDNVNIDIGRFVLLYNKWAPVWLEESVRKTKATQKIDEVQYLVKKDSPLIVDSTFDTHIRFKLPDDWFDHIGGYAIVHNATCTNVRINAYQIKNDNEPLVLFDDNWRPSLEFEWLPITVGGGTIQVYFHEFTVDQFYLDYFKYPKAIDIAGYVKPDGTPSITVDPDLDDIYVNEIIDLVVADVSRIYQNNEKLQPDLNRITTTN